MDNISTIMSVLCIALNINQGASDINITYVNKELSWTGAKDYCFNNGGLMENDYTELIRRHTGGDSYWIGTFTSWSEWAADWGCYYLPEVKPNRTFLVRNVHQNYCQRLCYQHELFSLKGTSCYCYDQLTVSSVNRRQCDCENCDFVHVFKKNIVGVQESQTTEKLRTCLSAQCQQSTLILTAEYCQTDYEGICDTNRSVGFTNQQTAVLLCNQTGSYLKWYTSDFCPNERLNQLWTRATREIFTSNITSNDQHLSLVPIDCMYVNSSDAKVMIGSCYTSRKFYCRFDSNKDEGTTKIYPEVTSKDTFPMPSNQDNLADVLAGTLSAIVLVFIIVILTILFTRWRKNENFAKDMASKPIALFISEIKPPSIEGDILPELHCNNHSDAIKLDFGKSNSFAHSSNHVQDMSYSNNEQDAYFEIDIGDSVKHLGGVAFKKDAGAKLKYLEDSVNRNSAESIYSFTNIVCDETSDHQLTSLKQTENGSAEASIYETAFEHEYDVAGQLYEIKEDMMNDFRNKIETFSKINPSCDGKHQTDDGDNVMYDKLNFDKRIHEDSSTLYDHVSSRNAQSFVYDVTTNQPTKKETYHGIYSLDSQCSDNSLDNPCFDDKN